MIERIKVILFMTLIALVFGAGVTGIHLATIGIVEANEAFLREKAKVELFRLTEDVSALSKEQITDLTAKQVKDGRTIKDPESGQEFKLLEAYDESGQLKAYAFQFEGIGFWAAIKGYLAVNKDFSKVIGIKILQQAETPGLGGRIEEEVFTTSFFKGLDITPPSGKSQFLYMGTPEFTPQQGSPQYGRKFDAITGATQTSMAMERMLNEDVAAFVRAMKSSKGGN